VREQVFDDFARSDQTRSDHSEATFSFLNRSAWPACKEIRSETESWFSRYPLAERAELRTRLRSTLDREHEGAFFELLLHELLTRLGGEVVVHPSVGPTSSKTPDFLVTTPGSGSFYLEAALVTDESPRQASGQRRMNRVLDMIEEVDSPDFFVSVECDDPPAADTRSKWLKRKLTTWLSELNYEEVREAVARGGLDCAPRLTWI
jgi:hypothetical protein